MELWGSFHRFALYLQEAVNHRFQAGFWLLIKRFAFRRLLEVFHSLDLNLHYLWKPHFSPLNAVVSWSFTVFLPLSCIRSHCSVIKILRPSSSSQTPRGPSSRPTVTRLWWISNVLFSVGASSPEHAACSRCMLHVVCSRLRPAGWVLHAVCCVLHAAGCMLRPACSMLYAASCRLPTPRSPAADVQKAALFLVLWWFHL